jgi:hypothetical protein
MTRRIRVVVAAACLAWLTAPPVRYFAASLAAQAPDSARTGRFDAGKMWAFEYAPGAYFSETYGFQADSGWFARARMAALRIPGCSAAFVSPQGLVATNHHCVRGRVTQVARPGETLLDDGFFAGSLDAERPVPGLYADQLLAARDVSDEILAAVDRENSDSGRERARREASAAIQARLRGEYGTAGDSIVIQVVSLYHGGRHSAYVFRRFTDLRLVAAVELQMGFFGGDEDNFVYPRYALDFAFLRVYGADGRPYATDNWFRWSREGVRAGDAVFVIGNPGPTSRLLSVSQLEFQRDVQVPANLDVVSTGLSAMRAYRASQPAEAEAYDIRNRMFGLSNSEKQAIGRLAALRDEAILGRKRDAESALRAAIAARPELRRSFDGIFDRLADLQREKRALSREWRAFNQLATGLTASAVLRRALAAQAWREGPPDSSAARRARLLSISDVPAELDRRLLAARLDLVARALGSDDALVRAALGGRSAADVAGAIAAGSALTDSTRTAVAVAGGGPAATDPAMRLAAALAPRFAAFTRESERIAAAERELASQLGRARFAIYGRGIPPDATSSPRVSDGVVQSYDAGGTIVPWHTTFFGLYDRHASHGSGTSWDLPARWRKPPGGLDLATPLNFVSTADTYGGNSGSPAIRPDLSLVGLNFDRNMEGLSRDFIYLPERGRNIMVDARAILAALDDAYDLDRIVRELLTGRVFATEAEADAVAP